MAFKFYTSVAEKLKLKVRKFWGLIPMFVEVTRGKVIDGAFLVKSLKGSSPGQIFESSNSRR